MPIIEVTEEYGTNPAEYDLGEFIVENREDPEFMAALPKLLAGECVTIGGGAAPIYNLLLLPDRESLNAATDKAVTAAMWRDGLVATTDGVHIKLHSMRRRNASS